MDQDNVTFSSADMKDLYNEVFSKSDVVKEELNEQASELDIATKVTDDENETVKDNVKTDVEGLDTDDLPWETDDAEGLDKEEDKPTTESDDLDDDVEDLEELKKLELSEKWRQKRLNKELDKRKAAEEENARLKAELESLRKPTEPKAPTPKPVYENPKTIDEYVGNLIFQDPIIIELTKKEQYIKSHKHEFADMGEYADALSSIQTDLKTEIKFKDREIREYIAKEQYSQQSQELDIEKTYNQKIESVKELYPHVTKAKDELNKIADKLHIEIRRALVMDENSGELTWALGSSKKNMNYLLEASKTAETNGRLPIDAIKFIGRLSSEINKGKVPDDTDVRIAKGAKGLEDKVLPKTIKQRPGRSNDENDPVQWAKAVREGKIKAPSWLM